MAAGSKPVTKDDGWEDVGDWEDAPAATVTPTQTPSPVTVTPPPQGDTEEGWLSKGWHMLSDPITDAPSRLARTTSEWMTDPRNALFGMQETGQGGFHDYMANTLAKLRGFEAGAVEGAGDLVSGLTSPINLATTALSGGAGYAAKAGLPTVAKAAGVVAKGAGALTAAHGAINTLHPDSTLSERASGVLEMAGGAASMFHMPTTEKLKAVGETGEKATPPSQVVDTGKLKRGTRTVLPSDAALEAGQKAGLPTGVADPYNAYRKAPVGTTYRVSPGDMSQKKLVDAIRLGFDYGGLDDSGKIVLKKIKESPTVKLPEITPDEGSKLLNAMNLPRAIMASWDMSAPLRQGLPLIHRKEFWRALPEMVRAMGSEEAYNTIQDSIKSKPLFRNAVGADGSIQPSFAERSGLKLTDLNNLSNREESFTSKWAEKIPGVRRSERAYTVFLNKLRADTFESLVETGKVFGADSRANLPLARELADFVNTATGRGDLGKLEKAAPVLSNLLFSPRLIASRLRMLDPRLYLMSNPTVRKEAIKSVLAMAAVGNTLGMLAKASGAGEYSLDPSSSDFGKIKFGNTRLDPWGGFQQYLVAANRLLNPVGPATGFGGDTPFSRGQMVTSSTSGREYDIWNPRGPFDPSWLSVAGRFGRGKLHPALGFATSVLMGAKEPTGKAMNFTTMNPMENSIAQRFIPIFLQDLYSLAQDPSIPAPLKGALGAVAGLGGGVQTYEED